MTIAKSSDWGTKALPSKRTTIRLDRTFTADEMERIRNGVVPEQMEDKWFIYWEDDTLFFHRSWTRHCVYVVRFANQSNGGKMFEAAVNREPEQYKETSDQKDAALISYLVDVLLLHQHGEFPCDEQNPMKWFFTNWHWVGRGHM